MLAFSSHIHHYRLLCIPSWRSVQNRKSVLTFQASQCRHFKGFRLCTITTILVLEPRDLMLRRIIIGDNISYSEYYGFASSGFASSSGELGRHSLDLFQCHMSRRVRLIAKPTYQTVCKIVTTKLVRQRKVSSIFYHPFGRLLP